LPFVGNKCRWWRELGEIARRIPAGWRVLDAFGGSYAISRVMKNANPDLDITTLDYGGEYLARLEHIEETAQALERMWETCDRFGEPRGGAVRGRFVRFKSPGCLRECLAIAEGAFDKETLLGYIYGRYTSHKNTPLNKIPASMPFSADARDRWLDGLRVVPTGCLGAAQARAHCLEYDLIICDPPYYKNNMYNGDAWRANNYVLEVCREARNFIAFERWNTPCWRCARCFGASELARGKFSGRCSIGDERMFIKM
jgi:hypothetical protein